MGGTPFVLQSRGFFDGSLSLSFPPLKLQSSPISTLHLSTTRAMRVAACFAGHFGDCMMTHHLSYYSNKIISFVLCFAAGSAQFAVIIAVDPAEVEQHTRSGFSHSQSQFATLETTRSLTHPPRISLSPQHPQFNRSANMEERQPGRTRCQRIS